MNHTSLCMLILWVGLNGVAPCYGLTYDTAFPNAIQKTLQGNRQERVTQEIEQQEQRQQRLLSELMQRLSLSRGRMADAVERKIAKNKQSSHSPKTPAKIRLNTNRARAMRSKLNAWAHMIKSRMKYNAFL